MAFARARVAPRLAPYLSASLRTRTPEFAFVARRMLSNSRCSNAEHTSQQSPTHLTSAEIRSPPLGTGTMTAANELGKSVNPYKGGPSAIDKAVHLFFFTEIIRGTL